MVGIPGADGKTRKGYEPGSNYCYDLFEIGDKKANVKSDAGGSSLASTPTVLTSSRSGARSTPHRAG